MAVDLDLHGSAFIFPPGSGRIQYANPDYLEGKNWKTTEKMQEIGKNWIMRPKDMGKKVTINQDALESASPAQQRWESSPIGAGGAGSRPAWMNMQVGKTKPWVFFYRILPKPKYNWDTKMSPSGSELICQIRS